MPGSVNNSCLFGCGTFLFQYINSQYNKNSLPVLPENKHLHRITIQLPWLCNNTGHWEAQVLAD